MVSNPMGVMVRPGVTQFTRMRGARARAVLLAKLTSPALAAA